MNREILFRGKRIQGGDWVYGYFFKSDINKREREIGIATLIFTPDCDTFIMVPELHNSFMVVADTIGRYTGLTDKNGVKIFEGDILDLKNFMITDVGVVKFGEYKDNDMSNDFPCGHVGFYVDIEEHKRTYVRKDILFFASKCKIIGNIHDNPEMMGGETND